MLNWAVGAHAVGKLSDLSDLIVSCHYRIGRDQTVKALYFFFDAGRRLSAGLYRLPVRAVGWEWHGLFVAVIATRFVEVPC